MNYKLIGLMLLLFVVAGCAESGTTSTTEGYYSCFGDEDQMIEAYFADYAPLSSESNTYQPGEQIDIEVVLDNKMPLEIPESQVKVRLTGDAAIDTIFSGASVETNPVLYAADQDTCSANDDEVNIGPLIYQKELDTKISKEIEGQYCYEMPVEVQGFLYFTEDETEIGENLPSGANPPSSVKITAIEQEIVDVDRDSNTGELRFKVTIQNTGEGTIVEDLDECFQYRETGYKEYVTLSVEGAYRPECSSEIKLSRDTKEEVVTCKVYDVDVGNLGSNPSEIKFTLDGFAYEDSIGGVTVWLEP
tara:strand:+ start:4025 stop:4936 length:912 start_codon:yes stop_codon:yes gene_type:complete